MRELFFKLFADNESKLNITWLSGWHFMYLILIIGLSILGGGILKNKSDKAKKTTVSVLAILVAVSYISDFFIQPFYSGDGNMIIDKLPFHICTLMCPLSLFVQFNKKFEWLRTPVTVLSLVATLMYVTYPGSAIGDISPFTYKVVQTFFYHGVLFAWAYLSLATGQVKLSFKNIWKELLLIIAIALWATLGNNLYSSEDHHYDWFFLTGSTFPFIPSYIMPLVVVGAVFGMVAIIYSIYYAVVAIANNIKLKKTINQPQQEK